MKMSDVFNLPLKVDGSTVYDLRPSMWLGEPSVENNYSFGVQNTKAGDIERDATALIIAECVNQHDALTQLNKELVEALERVVKWNELSLKTRCDIGSNGARDYYRGIAEEALAKTKELAE